MRRWACVLVLAVLAAVCGATAPQPHSPARWRLQHERAELARLRREIERLRSQPPCPTATTNNHTTSTSLSRAGDLALPLRGHKQDSSCEFSTSLQFVDGLACAFGTAVALLALSGPLVLSSELLAASPNLLAVVLQFPTTHSPFLSELGTLQDLQFLVTQFGLEGPVPTQIGRLTKLLMLSSVDNKLVGAVPSQVSLLTSVVTLVFRRSPLSGQVPSQIALLSTLEAFDVSTSSTVGQLQDLDLSNNPNLASLAVYGNHLTGEITPQFLAGIPSVRFLALDVNNLSGTLPSEIGLLSQLSYFWAGDNHLSGTLPSQLGRLTLLWSLSVRYNEFSGVVPSQLGLLTALFELYLNNNKLIGTFPPAMYALSRLTVLQLGDNAIMEGPFLVDRFRGDLQLDCPNSGLDYPGCEIDCGACSAFSLKLQDCDSSGRGKLCLAGFYVVLGLVGVVGFVFVVVRRALPPKMRERRGLLLRATGLGALGAVDMLTDIAFASTNPGAIGAGSASLLAFFGVFNIWVCTRIVRTRLSPDYAPCVSFRFESKAKLEAEGNEEPEGGEATQGEGNQASNPKAGSLRKAGTLRPEHHVDIIDRARANPPLFVLVALLCVLNIRLLPVLMGPLDHDTPRLTLVTAVVTMALETVPQMVLQVVVFFTGTKTIFVLLALALSSASLVLELTKVLLFALFLRESDSDNE